MFRRRSGGTRWGVLMAAGVASCEVPSTQLLVGVDTELPWGPGGAIQSVTLEVRRGDESGALRSRRTTALGAGNSRQGLPLWVAVVSADDGDASPLWLEALGCATPDGCTRETSVVTQRASVRFVRGETRTLRMLLGRACVARRCALTERCAVTTGQCVGIDAQGELGAYGGALPGRWADGGVGDAAAPDAAREDVAALDASLPPDAGADVVSLADGPDVIEAGVDAAPDVGVDASDAGTPDAGTPDAGTPDTGTPDAGTADAGTPDAGTADAGTADAGTPDAGTPLCAGQTCPCSTTASAGWCVVGETCTAGACVSGTLVGALVISEIMNDPDAVADMLGEWFEVYNRSETPVDLRGVRVRGGGTEMFEIIGAGPVLVAGHGYAVLGITGDTATNGGVTLTFAYGSAMTFGNTGTDVVTLLASDGTTVIDTVTYGTTVGSGWPVAVGRTKSLRPMIPDATTNDQGTAWCPGGPVYGRGDFGTPGAANVCQ